MKPTKSKPGTCTVGINFGKFRIRLPRSVGNGKQYFVYTGLSTNSINQKIAQQIALQIESDIDRGILDTSLKRYKRAIEELSGKQIIEKASKYPSLDELWDKYALFQEKQVSKAYFYNHYIKLIPSAIAKLPTQQIGDALKIRDALLERDSAKSAKRYLVQFNACCDWACRSGLIDSNPFQDMARDIKAPQYSWKNIEAFNTNERDRIIQAFDEECPEYADFVKFAFLTGMRLGEIIALQWRDISPNFDQIHIHQTYCRSFGRKPTKTNEKRQFPCNAQLRELLTKIKTDAAKPDDAVFMVRGNLVKVDRLLRIWKGRNSNNGSYQPGIVTQLAETGEISKYLKPYAMRHSFISSCLAAGIPVAQVAAWCGNSPQTIHNHYCGIVSGHDVPEF